MSEIPTTKTSAPPAMAEAGTETKTRGLRKKFYAHDEESKAQVGDLVRIMETRPLSKLKRWRLVEVLKH